MALDKVHFRHALLYEFQYPYSARINLGNASADGGSKIFEKAIFRSKINKAAWWWCHGGFGQIACPGNGQP